MKKLLIGKTLGEIFRTYFKSLPDLFKNNWLLIMASLTISGLMVFDMYTHQNIIFTYVESQTFTYEGAQTISTPMPFTGTMQVEKLTLRGGILLIINLLLSYMLYGYTMRYVNTKNQGSIGLGGVYINMPLIKMLISFLLTTILVAVSFACLIAIVIIGLALVGIGAGLTINTMPELFKPGVLALPAVLLIVTTIIVLFVWYVYIALRFTTVGAYSFLNNQIAVFRPFKQTKSNVMRIFIICLVTMFLTGIVMFGLNMLGAMMVNSISMFGQTAMYVVPSALILALLVMFVAGYLPIVTYALIYKGLTTTDEDLPPPPKEKKVTTAKETKIATKIKKSTPAKSKPVKGKAVKAKTTKTKTTKGKTRKNKYGI